MNHKHKHNYYEYTSNNRKPKPGSGGIVMCRNDADCVHFLEPRAMQIFRRIVAAKQTPVIRTYPKTYNRKTNREMVAIYPKPITHKSHKKHKDKIR